MLLCLCTVYLDCAFVSGHVNLAVVDSLPAVNVSVFIGHDLAGAQVALNPIVSPVPTLENNTRKLEQDHPKIFPACAVIRNISKTLAETPLIENSNSIPVLVDQPRGVSDTLKEEFTLTDFFLPCHC